MNGINLRTFNINKITSLSDKNDLSSEDGLVKEYKKLSIQLKQLQILEKRYTDQLEQRQTDEDTLTENMRKFSNLVVSGRLLCLCFAFKRKENDYL